MVVTTLWLTEVETSARADRGILTDLFTEGVKNVQANQFKVIPRAAGANMTVTVRKGDQDNAVAYITGDDFAGQGLYRSEMDADWNDLTIAAAPASGTRTDTVVWETVDKSAVGGTVNESHPRVLTGVAALTAAHKTMIPLARVTVAAGQGSIQAQHITDLRFQADKAQLSFAATDVQWFTTSATWVKVNGARAVEVILIGGGQSGASGQAAGAGQSDTPNGGAGGRGGERVRVLIPAASLPATVPVVVGAGGATSAPAAYVSNVFSPAGPQNPGGDSSFAGVVARGGTTNRASFTGGAGGTPVPYYDPSQVQGSELPSGGNSNGGGAGGGGGKSRFQTSYQGPAGPGGVNNEVATTAATNTATGGRGGAGGDIAAGGTAGASPGGGGGGGGANGVSGGNAGPGGKGGDGLVVVITYT